MCMCSFLFNSMCRQSSMQMLVNLDSPLQNKCFQALGGLGLHFIYTSFYNEHRQECMISDLKFVNLPSLDICLLDFFFFFFNVVTIVKFVPVDLWVHFVRHDMNSCSESAL